MIGNPEQLQGVRVVLNDGSKWIVPFAVTGEPEFGFYFETQMGPAVVDQIIEAESDAASVDVVTLPFDEYYDGTGSYVGGENIEPVDITRMFATYRGMPEKLTDV